LKRKLLISIVLALIASVVLTSPVFACTNSDPRPRPARVEWYNGGEATINLPTDPSLLTNYPPSATMMKIGITHVEFSTNGINKCALLIELYMFDNPTSTVRTWEPYAVITTDANNMAFFRNFWSGTYVEFPGPHYAPIFVTTDNVILVPSWTLRILGHGDDVYVNLAAPQLVENPKGLYFTIPAFCLKLDGYQPWIHTSDTVSMTGWYGASGYTVNEERWGFNANGEFTSSTWSYNNVDVSDGRVTVCGIDTFYAPTA